MWRWGYDIIFFRVVCVSLVAFAFIFTVILTNVFVDVDGFLMSKAQNKHSNEIHETTFNKMKEDYSNEDQNSDDVSGYRARRSLEYNENFPNVKNPNLKKVLNKQLAVLLEELDEEETVTIKPTDEPDRRLEKMDKMSNDISEEDLHRSLHEILLEGITDHMDFGAIYNKIKNIKKASKEVIKRQKERSNEEHLLINEIVKCKKLAGDVEQLNMNEQNTKTTEATKKVKNHKDHNVIVKSEVQIWNENNKHNYTKGNINGFIKMIYNGKLVNLSQMQNELDSILKADNKPDIEEATTNKSNKGPDSYPVMFDNNNAINTLLKRFFKKDIDLHNTEIIRHKPRHKRQVIDDPSDTTTNKPTVNKNFKSDKHIDIEIETQFDGKDIKGGRKQFISNLIEKIKNALTLTEVSNYKKASEVQFIKRIQDPIVVTELSVLKSKIIPPFEKIERREVDQISKFLNREENTYNKVEDVWSKSNNKPKFLTASKSVNSAEMQKVNINYDQVLRNGIAKRFQKPITDNTEETDDATSRIYSNLGNVTLLLKDIIGTGFSIGYNQYLDDPPDKDSLKAFNGLENLIREYHNTYDYGDINNQVAPNDLNDAVQAQHEITKRNAGNRKKLIVNVKKITNLKSKLKINRYINTDIMAKKSLFLKNKRHKRHLDNIRIVASDKIIPFFNGSDEDLYIISRDNRYSDRAPFIKESNINDVIKTRSSEIYDDNMPVDEMYHEQPPMVQSIYEINPYENQLMSKYPHIFAEVDTNQRSSYDNVLFKGERNARIGSLSERPIIMAEDKILPYTITQPEVLPGVEDIMHAIIPKSRYKVTLKITPQNNNTNTGFKEIHTSVNKSYDKDGLHYFSLINVSEISKVEKLNQTSEVHKADIINEESKKAMERKKSLTQQKRKVDEQLTRLIDESKKLDKIIHSLSGHNKELYIRSPNMYIDSKTNNDEKVKIKDAANNGVTNKKIKQFKRESKDIFDELQTLKLFKRNENVTAEILKRIDLNTNMLQNFLDKLYNNVELAQKNNEANKKEIVETTPPITMNLNKPTRSYDLEKRNDQIVTARIGSLIIPLSNILYEEQDYKRIGKNKDLKQATNIRNKLVNTDDRRRLNKTNFFY